MADHPIDCALEPSLTGDGEIALSFLLRNSTGGPVEVRYLAPMVDFDLTASIDGVEVPVFQPASDIGLQPASMTVPPGHAVRIATPIRLRYEPDVQRSADEVQTRWILRHAPGPTLLRASVRLGDAFTGTCEAWFDPQGTD